MKILHCLFSQGFAGTERHVAELASEQARRHDVGLLLAQDCGNARTGDIRAHLAPAVQVRCLPRFALSLGLWAELRRQAPDIVHAHLGRAAHRLAWLRPDTAMIATLHRQYRAWPHSAFDAVLCIAGWQRSAVADHHLAIETIYNWTVPRPAPSPAERAARRGALGVADHEFLFGTAGRMVAEKEFDILLAAFARAGLRNARLVLFGDGPERARLQATAPRGTIFTGWQPGLPDWLGALDAFVLPSRREPFGLVLLEAMAAGLPVAACASGGPLEILGSSHPFLAAPGDVAAWASCLFRLHGTHPAPHDLSRFVLERQARRIERVYEHVLAARAAAWRPLPAAG